MATVQAYIGLGSNIGNRYAFLCQALTDLAHSDGISINYLSSIYESVPVGPVVQGNFFNMVAGVQVQLPATELLQRMQAIEAHLGRTRTVHWGPRQLDLDLLTYGNVCCATSLLTLPHPQLTKRAFVLVPLAEVAPDLIVAGFSIRKHLEMMAPAEVEAAVWRWSDAPRLVAGSYL